MIFRYLLPFFSRKQSVGKYLPAMFLALAVTFWVAPPATATGPSCCIVRGNVDCDPDGIVDIADLARLIDNLFISFTPLCCDSAANIDADSLGEIDIADINRIIDYLFISFAPIVPCNGSELTDDQREAFLTAMDSTAKALVGLAPESLAVHLAAFLNSRTEIDSAGIIDNVSVWAYFTDSRLLLIPNNRRLPDSFVADLSTPQPEYELQPPPDFVCPKRRFSVPATPSALLSQAAEPSVANNELPSSLQARLISNFSPSCFPQSVPIIKNLLDQGGYVTTVTSGTVSSLLNVQNEGVFYIDTHGGAGVDRAHNLYHALWTNSFYTRPNETAFAPMLRNHELAYMYAHDYNVLTAKCEDHYRYCITPAFVAQYMYFVPNSFVFINACMSDSIPALRNGFFTAGASTFCGFTKSVSFPGSNRMAEYVFDRMLGANASTLSPKESPPQRPFDIDPIYADMVSRQLDIDRDDPKFQNNARLRVEHLQSHMGLLAPSIRNLAVVEHFDTLYVLGMFGTDPGPSKRRVIVGGTDMLVYDWKPEMITCFIPNSGAGSVGPVTVEVDGTTGPSSSIKRVSNTVNLTEWKGQFTYSLKDSGTLLKTIVFDAHLRADIHKFRDYPHTAPIFYSIIFPAAEDSYGLATVSGTYSYTWPNSDPTSIDTWTWTGSTYLPGLWQGGLDFVMSGQVDAPTQIMKFRLVAAVTGGLKETITNNLGGSPTIYDLSVSIPWELYDAFPELFNLTLSNTWDIVGSQRLYDACCSVWPENDGTVNDLHHKLQWPTITASFPPDTAAAQ